VLYLVDFFLLLARLCLSVLDIRLRLNDSPSHVRVSIQVTGTRTIVSPLRSRLDAKMESSRSDCDRGDGMVPIFESVWLLALLMEKDSDGPVAWSFVSEL
jgi:hypothetical protein